MNPPATPSPAVTFLGLGEMGGALAAAALDAGYAVTVWNRSSGRADAVAARGAARPDSIEGAVPPTDLVIACLFDADSVHQTLDPVVATLRGRTLVNVTT